jgi:hypothetical protein
VDRTVVENMAENPKRFFAAVALAFVSMLVLASVCQANPIPLSYTVRMTREDINVYVYQSLASVEGIYTFDVMRMEATDEVHMFYPLPPNAEKIKVVYIKDDGQEDVNWKRSSLEYETALGKYYVIEWTVRNSPAIKFPFKILVSYQYELPRQKETYVMLYAMGSVKLTHQLNMSNLVYSKDCQVSLNTYFPSKPKELEAYLIGVWMVDDLQVSDGKWPIQEGKMDVSRHESEWVGYKFVVSTELRLSLLTMGCDYAIQFESEPAAGKFAWIESLSADKSAYMPGENVTLETAVKRGNDMLAVVYEAEVRYRLLVDGEDMGLLGSSRIEIPSPNGLDTALFTFQLPDKQNHGGWIVVRAELWSWGSSLEDVKEVKLEIVDDGGPPTEHSPMWISAIIAITAAVAVTAAAIIATLYRRKFRRHR